MLDIPRVLADLATRRPIFHSEADFQHALAWEIHQHIPEASIRLELPLPSGQSADSAFPDDSRPRLDICAVWEDTILAIELKYKTRNFSVQSGHEQFTLANHPGESKSKYLFVEDIRRLEQAISDRRLEYIFPNRKVIIGFAILLTNRHGYWKKSQEVR